MTNECAVIFALILGLGGCGRTQEETATRGQLGVLASESLAPLVQKEADLFVSLYPEGKVSVRGVDTRGAMVALLNDSVNFVVTDRPFNDEERKVVDRAGLEIEELSIAKDALAVLVNEANRLEEISWEALERLLRGEIRTWEEIPASGLSTPVELAVTGVNSGAYELLRDHFFRLGREIPAAVMPSTQREVMRYVSDRAGAVGFVSVACWKEETREPSPGAEPWHVRPLAFTAVDSAGRAVSYGLYQAYIHLGKYPLGYPVYILIGQGSPLGTGFSAFIASAPGQKIILDWGLVPVTMPVRLVQLNP